MPIPLAQLSDALQDWRFALTFVLLPALPLAGFVLGLLFRRRFSFVGMYACVGYYVVLGLTITLLVAMRWQAMVFVVAGLLLSGPLIGLLLLIFSFSPYSKPVESHGFPVVPKGPQP